MSYHVPVMLKECIEGLDIKPDGVYVDVTFGGGGHSKEILKHLTEGKLFAFDQDEDAKANAQSIESRSFTFIEANFRHLKKFLRLHGISKVNGILADLGVSSHQINSAERGFSTRFDAELDMRMDRNSNQTAQDIINQYPQEDLHKILGMYGEITNAKTVASAIISARINKPINTVEDLKKAIQKFAPRGKENKFYAQVFQALRIEVNQELKVLEELLTQSAEVLAPGGRLVVMSYHSLEDRLVKNFIKEGKFFGEAEKDLYGNVDKPFDPVNRKPIVASEEEVKENNRARSAKLRIAEKRSK
jgi:16S rRNA (cytosine1402-N4)-methyltransferase